jgi:hypothetical protein
MLDSTFREHQAAVSLYASVLATYTTYRDYTDEPDLMVNAFRSLKLDLAKFCKEMSEIAGIVLSGSEIVFEKEIFNVD